MFLPKLNFSHFIKCNYDPKDLPQEIPKFYYQILFAWFCLKKEPKTPLEVRRELVILNQYISINNEYFFDKNLVDKNTLMINDFFCEEGRPLKHNQFTEKHGNILSHFKYMSLVDAIPPNWRKLLKTQTFEKTCCNINEQPHCHVSQTIIRNVFMVSSRELYWAMINQNALQPSCIKAWNQRLDIDVEKSTWEMLFVLPFRCVQNITVKEMQLKILHRFYPIKV